MMQNKKRNRFTLLIISFIMIIASLTACASVDTAGKVGAEDGVYSADVTLEGGSGRAGIESPAKITVKDGEMYATIVWSSANYDYMLVDGEKYLNENPDGNSTFTIPITGLLQKIPVIADTTAMSTPHEIEYTLYFEEINEAKAATVDFNTLTCTGHLELKYATQYEVDQYGRYDLITIVDDGRFLLVPEGEVVPENVPDDVTVLQQPLDHTYLVSTSAMDLIQTIEAISMIRLSGTKKDSWYIEEAVNEMEKGNLLYAGKYSMPDYELILKEKCNFAIENTMIYHNPEVKEKLKELGIPVLVERSSYEAHPLGRLEWIKLYGILFGKEEGAKSYYRDQLEKIEPIMEKENTGHTVAFFSVTSNGAVTVRKPKDYIAQMINLAGGEYVLDDILPEEDNALSTMKMQMENFYVAAKDADILIYNSTIEGDLGGIGDLIKINPLFAEFKGVKEGKVYCTNRDFFQKSTGAGAFIEDLNQIVTDTDTDNLTFMKKLR